MTPGTQNRFINETHTNNKTYIRLSSFSTLILVLFAIYYKQNKLTYKYDGCAYFYKILTYSKYS